MAGEFAVYLRDGDVHSVTEIGAWLDISGRRFERHEPLAGPVSLVVARAV